MTNRSHTPRLALAFFTLVLLLAAIGCGSDNATPPPTEQAPAVDQPSAEPSATEPPRQSDPTEEPVAEEPPSEVSETDGAPDDSDSGAGDEEVVAPEPLDPSID
ncbi:MAG: hypothetical protein AAGC60_01280 [Acidobacteriota bacterium]